jgi:AcrR family transcriptional regulator
MPKPSRAEAKQASRDALIKSAMELMPKKGIDVSLDELCAHAGYTRGAFYVHFKNRDELTLEVMTIKGELWLNSIFRPKLNGEAEDLITMVQRFLSEMASGTYPISQEAGLRPHQLLEACARNEAIKMRYLELITDSIRRLTVNVKQSQADQQLSQVLDPEQVASLLLALAIGTHTMYDLDYPIDFAKGAMTLLQLLAK